MQNGNVSTGIDRIATDPATWPADILTAVVRVPTDIGATVSDSIGPLRHGHPEHYYYPLESLHLTIRSFRGLSEVSGELDAATSALRLWVGQASAPSIRIRGVGLSDGSAFLRAHVSGSARSTPSADLAVGMLGLRVAPASSRVPHVNFMRFMRDLVPDVRHLLTSMDSHDFGSFAPTEVVIVRCNQVMAPDSLTVIEHIPFAREDVTRSLARPER